MLLSSAFAVLYYFNAYVCDDAFITFRCVDNFLRGEGLRWNVGERVQTFTSPLHTLLTCVLYSVFRDPSELPNPDRMYWFAVFFSFVISAVTLLLLVRAWGSGPMSWVLFALLMSSQAFVTFCSSGLETPLTYLLLTLFYVAFLRPEFLSTKRDCFFAFLWVGLGLLNRLDLVLLFLPALAYTFLLGWKRIGWRVSTLALAGLAPVLVWLAFSLCYYGFLLPNAYYAKLGLGVPRTLLLSMGGSYLGWNLAQDPVTLVLCAVGLALCWSDIRALLTGSAVVLYVLYIFSIGGDFLGFRFLAPPFLLSILIVHHRLEGWRARLPSSWWRYALAGALVYGALVPSSPLRAFRDPPVAPDVSFYYPASGVARWTPGARFPFARFLHVTGPEECQRLYATEPRVAVWGDGLNGFCRGPRAHLIDPHGITDPLMARITPHIEERFLPGHLGKPVPVGYPESWLAGENRIKEPELAAYYDRLRVVTSGPLWTRERWKNIWALNFTSAARYPGPYEAYAPVPKWMREDAGPLLTR